MAGTQYRGSEIKDVDQFRKDAAGLESEREKEIGQHIGYRYDVNLVPDYERITPFLSRESKRTRPCPSCPLALDPFDAKLICMKGSGTSCDPKSRRLHEMDSSEPGSNRNPLEKISSSESAFTNTSNFTTL